MDNIKPSKIIITKVGELNASTSGEKGSQEVRDSRMSFPESFPDGIQHYQLQEFFKLSPEEKLDANVNNQVRDVLQWATIKARSSNFIDIIRYIRQIDDRMGSTNFGESRFNKIHRYATIDKQINNLEYEKQKMENL